MRLSLLSCVREWTRTTVCTPIWVIHIIIAQMGIGAIDKKSKGEHVSHSRLFWSLRACAPLRAYALLCV